jgi:two-component system invasion response regulator UvrY
VTRVLVVDDHDVVRRGLRYLLAEEVAGCEVGEASSAAPALELLEQGGWNLVLLDLNLPGRDGLDLLAQLRARWPSLPVLVLSAYPEEEFAVRCLRLGAAGYVTKASLGEELVAAVTRVLAGGRYVSAELGERLATLLAEPEGNDPHALLSARELQVLQLVARGRSQKEIAAELSLSEKTIGTYRARIAEKLGISTSVELTRYALQHKLVD